MEFIQQNLALVALVLVSAVMVFLPELRKLMGMAAANEIGTLEATQLINRKNAIVLDVRDAGEFSAGHITNARNIPVAELEKRVEELKKFKDRPLILSCRTGARSASAVRILQKQSFNQLYSLKGGLAAWEQASLPLEKSA